LNWTVTITIPRVPMHANEILRVHRLVRWKLKFGWIDEFFAYLGYQPRKQIRLVAKESRMKVTILILWPTRRADPDNLKACVKPVVDAMRHMRLITNDSPPWLDLIVEQDLAQQVGQSPRTIIQIEPCAPEAKRK